MPCRRRCRRWLAWACSRFRGVRGRAGWWDGHHRRRRCQGSWRGGCGRAGWELRATGDRGKSGRRLRWQPGGWGFLRPVAVFHLLGWICCEFGGGTAWAVSGFWKMAATASGCSSMPSISKSARRAVMSSTARPGRGWLLADTLLAVQLFHAEVGFRFLVGVHGEGFGILAGWMAARDAR